MYDDLIQRLHRYSENCVAYKLDADFASAVQEAADAIEKQNKPKWIPVTERLPKNGVPILICGDGNVVEQGFFDDEYGYWYDWGGNRTFVHHWMPLPEPPKEKNS